MAEEQDDLKGRLLSLWLEDLKNDRPPGTHPEVGSLSPTELQEIIGLVRFIKGNLQPSNAMPVDVYGYASELAKVVSQERKDQIEFNRSSICKAESFGKLVTRLIGCSHVDRTILQKSLAIARNVLPDIETEQTPPHRLPVDSMVRLLVALRLASTEVVDLISRSAREWAHKTYSGGQTQLGRIDINLTDEERRRVMEDPGKLDNELVGIDTYCERLRSALFTIKGSQDRGDSHPADDETWLHR